MKVKKTPYRHYRQRFLRDTRPKIYEMLNLTDRFREENFEQTCWKKKNKKARTNVHARETVILVWYTYPDGTLHGFFLFSNYSKAFTVHNNGAIIKSTL